MAIPASTGQPPIPLSRFLLGPGETIWGELGIPLHLVLQGDFRGSSRKKTSQDCV
jgi:hypothetical protein